MIQTGAPDAAPPDAGPAPETESAGCAPVFDQNQPVPRFDVTLAPADWNAIIDEFWAPLQTYQETGSWPNPLVRTYHPVQEFAYGGATITNAMIRLKGNSSWRHTIQLDGDKAKMQFVISFNDIDPDGRFQHMRKLEFDMPRSDPTFLRQRLATKYLRADLGIPAACAASGRLYINGNYYGLYTTLEHLDKEFLQRNFGADDEGDLWDAGLILKTNETTATSERRDALFAVTTVDQLAALGDLPASIEEWAGEAMLPDGDGYYGGTHNFFLYDHPTRGFLWLPHDLDSALDFRRHDVSPLYWSRAEQPDYHYTLVTHDTGGLAAFEQAVCGPAYDAYDPDRLAARIDDWSAQIADAVRDDPHTITSVAEWQAAVAHMRTFVGQRKQFIADWCACRSDDAGHTDADSDSTAFCRDCQEDDASVPSGGETCGPEPIPGDDDAPPAPIDDDCDGYIDEAC